MLCASKKGRVARKNSYHTIPKTRLTEYKVRQQTAGKGIPAPNNSPNVGRMSLYMKLSESARARTMRFLAKMTKGGRPGWTYSNAPDPRQQTKIQHPMAAILWTFELAFLSNQRTLRDAEEMLPALGPWAKKLVPGPISDTTLDTESRRLNETYLLERLVLRVRDFHRSKMLNPVGLPFGVATVDGKNLATLDHDAAGTGHARSSDNKKWHLSPTTEAAQGESYFLMPALRATLSSAEAKPCIYQLPLPVETGESSAFPAFVSSIKQAYGHGQMVDVIDADAGMTSLKNADCVVEYGYNYVFGLKGNQTELFAEAQKLLLPLCTCTSPEIETPWELRNRKKIRRRLWRTTEMVDFENSVGKWKHLRQTWLVRQETRVDEKIEIEDRFFITSLPSDALSPAQILLLVRNHWAVENDCFNSLDLQWREDSAPWCTHGTAVWTLGILRLLAYNTAQVLRRRRLRKKRDDGTWQEPISWRSLFKIIERALELNQEEPCVTG